MTGNVIKYGQILGVFLDDGRLAAVALVRKFEEPEQGRTPRVFHEAWNLLDGSDLEME